MPEVIEVLLKNACHDFKSKSFPAWHDTQNHLTSFKDLKNEEIRFFILENYEYIWKFE